MGKKNRRNRKSQYEDNGLDMIQWCPACGHLLDIAYGEQSGEEGAWYYCPSDTCGQYMEFVPNPRISLTCGYKVGKQSSFYSTSGYGALQGGRLCDHWRDPVRVGVYYLTVSAWVDRPVEEDTSYPDMGVYVSELWMQHFSGLVGVGLTLPSKYKAIICDWPDYGVVSVEEVRWLVLWIVDCLEKGMDVDIGCHGAHGRTGALLACVIAYLEGCGALTAMNLVFKRHCNKCIETKGQANLVREFCGEPTVTPNKYKEWMLYLSNIPELRASMVEEK